jgi:hypothetical protein
MRWTYPGLLEQDRDGAIDDEQHLARNVPLAPEKLAVPNGTPAHHARQLDQVRRP